VIYVSCLIIPYMNLEDVCGVISASLLQHLSHTKKKKKKKLFEEHIIEFPPHG